MNIRSVLTRDKKTRLGITKDKKYPIIRTVWRYGVKSHLINTDDSRRVFVTVGGGVMGNFKEVGY